MAMYGIFGVTPPRGALTPSVGQRLVVGRWKTTKSSECLSPTTPDRSMAKGAIPWVPFLKGNRVKTPAGVRKVMNSVDAGQKDPAEKPVIKTLAIQKKTGDVKSPVKKPIWRSASAPVKLGPKVTRIKDQVKANPISARRPASSTAQPRPKVTRIKDQVKANPIPIRRPASSAAQPRPKAIQDKPIEDGNKGLNKGAEARIPPARKVVSNDHLNKAKEAISGSSIVDSSIPLESDRVLLATKEDSINKELQKDDVAQQENAGNILPEPSGEEKSFILLDTNASMDSKVLQLDGDVTSDLPMESEEAPTVEKVDYLDQKLQEVSQLETDGNNEGNPIIDETETSQIGSSVIMESPLAAREEDKIVASTDLIAEKPTTSTVKVLPKTTPNVLSEDASSSRMQKMAKSASTRPASAAQERNRLAIEKKIKQMSVKMPVKPLERPLKRPPVKAKVSCKSQDDVTGNSQRKLSRDGQASRTEARLKQISNKVEQKLEPENSKKFAAAVPKKSSVISRKSREIPASGRLEHTRQAVASKAPCKVSQSAENQDGKTVLKARKMSSILSQDLPPSVTHSVTIDSNQHLEDNHGICEQITVPIVAKTSHTKAAKSLMDLPGTGDDSLRTDTGAVENSREIDDAKEEADFLDVDTFNKTSPESFTEQISDGNSKSLSDINADELFRIVVKTSADSITTTVTAVTPNTRTSNNSKKSKQLSDTSIMKSTSSSTRKLAGRVMKKATKQGDVNKPADVKPKQLSDTSIKKTAESAPKQRSFVGHKKTSQSRPTKQSDTCLKKLTYAAPRANGYTDPKRPGDAKCKFPIDPKKKVPDKKSTSVSSKNARKSSSHQKGKLNDKHQERLGCMGATTAGEKGTKKPTAAKHSDVVLKSATVDDQAQSNKNLLFEHDTFEFSEGHQKLRTARAQHDLSSHVESDFTGVKDQLVNSEAGNNLVSAHMKDPFQTDSSGSSVDGPIKSTSLITQPSTSSSKPERLASLPNNHVMSTGKLSRVALDCGSSSSVDSETELLRVSSSTAATIYPPQDDEVSLGAAEAADDEASKDTTLGINLSHIFYYYIFSFALFVCMRLYEGDFNYDVSEQ